MERMTGSVLAQRLTLLASVVLLALALVQTEPSGVALAGAVTAVVSAALLAYYAGRVIRPAELTVGFRSRAHREVLRVSPEPDHPDTAGRPRPRAPGLRPAAA